ncbi:hypothetical protein ASG52_04330 [Methylobacterium sp. Leaf456]|uniref:phasin family protein n=1 Tax=Methylobacterium sp. Leaf456 TaxID=1736382 RepID=UPI0007007472|nr:phasin family protein [Methylobacterium sp. Leaf456]KQT53359.1 hypothetical protein ASG52_04330 [Methylobacterium sp. Leaf456]
MNAKHPMQIHVQAPSGAAEALGTGLTTWHALAVELPLRLTAETMRFASRRLQAQAEHMSALTRCGSLMGLVELQTAFVTKGVSDDRQEATTLSHDVQETAFAKAA